MATVCDRHLNDGRRPSLRKQVGAIFFCAGESLVVFPGGDPAVIAAEQDFGNFHVAEFRRAGVARRLDEAGIGKALFIGARGIAEHAGEQTDDGIEHYDGCNGAIGQDVIADGNFIIHQGVDDAMIDAFVVTAKHDEMGFAREFASCGLVESPALRRHEDRARGGRAQLIDGGEEWLGLHHHPGTTAVRLVIDSPMTVGRPIAQVVDVDFHQSLVLGTADDALSQWDSHDFRKKRDDIDAHERQGETVVTVAEVFNFRSMNSER
jgi:hypothetical protein